ncbi:MAG: aminotransferase class III-fold pyridoxal phosphate-dependent enzyme [Candidatus Hydrogenedentota bacterium]
MNDVSVRDLRHIATRKVSFFPVALQRRLSKHLGEVGCVCIPSGAAFSRGATSTQFKSHSNNAQAPLSTLGYFRVGENGRLYLTSKSEHYHAPLGHAFPGYALIRHAQALGIPNATHNNTRGHITRLLEQEMVRSAAGIACGDEAALAKTLRATSMSVLNRVLNLETGSLAAEAALKMILARFYRSEHGASDPKYIGRKPVIVVLGDEDGGLEANYHGTTFLTQIMRGMWPEMAGRLEECGAFTVRAIRPNNLADLEEVFARWDQAPYKIAGFFHELVLMNYGAIRLSKRFIKRAYTLCRKHNVPVVCDEIQSCVWSPDVYLFREYGLKPTFVVVGKGFPGGEYPASRILFSAAMDVLPQFGALVTNGQEELASLAYLITLRWVEANRENIDAVGTYYEERLQEMATRHSDMVTAIEGRRHLAGIFFDDVELSKRFAGSLNEGGLDISVQTYKKGCPPCALTKLPLIAGFDVVDLVVNRMEQVLQTLAKGSRGRK